MKVLLLLSVLAPAAPPAAPPATPSSAPPAALPDALPAASPALVARAELDHEHPRLTALLRRVVRGDRVDYRALKAERAALQRTLDELAAVTPTELAAWTRAQRFAFWINAYNAWTLARVVDAYPLESIRDLSTEERSVWDEPFVPLGRLHPEAKEAAKNAKLSLNAIEHEILRPSFDDPRVHAAVNCAAVGCPPLRAEAWVAARLDRQLDEQVRAWLADPQRNRYDRKTRTLRLSKIFEWYAEDWKDHGGVAAWVARYAPEEEAAWIRAAEEPKVRYLEYSWALNDVSE